MPFSPSCFPSTESGCPRFVPAAGVWCLEPPPDEYRASMFCTPGVRKIFGRYDEGRARIPGPIERGQSYEKTKAGKKGGMLEG